MKLNRLIIHEIIKNEIKLNSATVDLSQNLLTITQNEVDFVDHLNKGYINSRQSHGSFKTDEKDYFANEYLKSLLSAKRGIKFPFSNN